MKTTLEDIMVSRKMASRSKTKLMDRMIDKATNWNYQNVKELSVFLFKVAIHGWILGSNALITAFGVMHVIPDEQS